MKFIADHMLGTLAKWMRMLGFNVHYSPPVDDDELLKVAWRQDRVLLTRDKNINPFEDVKILYVKSDDLDEQLKEVIRTYDLEIKEPMSRCSLCNTPISEVGKENVLGKVPDGVYDRQDKFWFCEKCDKYYWAGSH
ncbi:MAG: Mut7-C RNAse domain-containing protein, partial [Thermoplasmata archaeon]|nr:Mut7-C RNAse domain-containing protein [Thermoplasmata archaeon]